MNSQVEDKNKNLEQNHKIISEGKNDNKTQSPTCGAILETDTT
jgi:hypothetical protein